MSFECFSVPVGVVSCLVGKASVQPEKISMNTSTLKCFWIYLSEVNFPVGSESLSTELVARIPFVGHCVSELTGLVVFNNFSDFGVDISYPNMCVSDQVWLWIPVWEE